MSMGKVKFETPACWTSVLPAAIHSLSYFHTASCRDDE